MFVLTKAGRNAILGNNAINAEFATISLGTGRYTSVNNDTKTALQTPIISSPLTTKSSANGRMQLIASIRTNNTTAIYEAGLFNRNGVLLAVYSSNTTPLFSTTAGITHAITVTVTL